MAIFETLLSFAAKVSASAIGKLWPGLLLVGITGMTVPDAAIIALAPGIPLETVRAASFILLVIGIIIGTGALAPSFKRGLAKVTTFASDLWLLYKLDKEARVMLGYFIYAGIQRGYMSPEIEAYQRIADCGLIMETTAGEGWRHFETTIKGKAFQKRHRARLRREAEASPEIADRFRAGAISATRNAPRFF